MTPATKGAVIAAMVATAVAAVAVLALLLFPVQEYCVPADIRPPVSQPGPPVPIP